MIRRRGTPRIVAVCITTSHLAVASRTQHQLRRGDDVVISTSISRASRASPRSPSRPRADRARARRLDACQLSLVPRSRETPHIASTLALGRPRRDMGHRRSNSAGSRGFSRASSARASSGARKSFRAGSAGTAPWKSARTLARANARHVTTGRARAPRPVKVYDNAHSRVVVYDNGGTTTQSRALITNKTPQARRQGFARAANYRLLNEKNHPYVGLAKGPFGNGRDVRDGRGIAANKAGHGSAVTSEDRRHRVDVGKVHATHHQAKQGETKLYYATKVTHGDSTRGAGHTRRRSLG